VSQSLLEVEELRVGFAVGGRELRAVDGISFSVNPGTTLAIIGESGSGKTVSCRAIMGLLPSGTDINGSARLNGSELIGLSDSELRRHRGSDMAMVFQDPARSLNPTMRVGLQITEAITTHRKVSKQEAQTQAVELLRLVRIPAAERRFHEYPHQLSGGMRQRAMIAMALACNPRVLIADEPTTALDVTIQAQILDLILELQKELGTAIILITHNLGVVAETAQRVIVMYAGKKVEEAEVDALFGQPLHPYTHGLLASIPRLEIMGGRTANSAQRLKEIPGMVPALTNLSPGCTFAPRCAFADDRCRAQFPPYEQKRPGHWAACWHSESLYGGGA